MSKGLEKKINKLENSVLEKPEIGSTRFCSCGLPEPEQTLLEKGRQIAAAHIPFSEATEDQKKILDEASSLLTFRVFDLFTSYLEGLLCHDDKTARIILHERFLWFITELREEIRQNLEVSEIEKNAPEETEVDLVDQYFRRAPKVFTENSYDKLTSEITYELIKEGKIKLPNVESEGTVNG